jgi:ribA/ribD-fused uncharacterized protein
VAIDSFRGPNRWLSNFSPCVIHYQGFRFPTAEHAFQAAKFDNEDYKKKIALLEKPTDAKRFGRDHSKYQRKSWGSERIDVMREILRIKFSNKAYRDFLLSTGDEELIEGNDWGDKFWGKVAGEGSNWLGIILMEIRKELQDGSSKSASSNESEMSTLPESKHNAD